MSNLNHKHKMSEEDAKKYIFSHSGNHNAGGTLFTIENRVTNHRHTYKIRKAKDKDMFPSHDL